MITGLGHVGIFVRDVGLGERMPQEPATMQF